MNAGTSTATQIRLGWREKDHWGRLNNVPSPRAHILTPGDLWTLYDSSVLRWDCPGLPGWAQWNPKSFQKKEAMGSGSEGEGVKAGAGVRDEKMLCCCWLWRWSKRSRAEGRGWPLQTNKGKETDPPLEPPEGVQSCWLTIDFRPPEL